MAQGRRKPPRRKGRASQKESRWFSLHVANLWWYAKRVHNQLRVATGEMLMELVFSEDRLEEYCHRLLSVRGQIETILRMPSFDELKRESGVVGETVLSLYETGGELERIAARGRAMLRQIKGRREGHMIKDFFVRSAESTLQKLDSLNKFIEGLEASGILEMEIQERGGNWGAFLCHSSVDKTFAKRLGEDIRKLNIEVWLDEWCMLPGDSLEAKIGDGIRESAWFVIVLSPSSVRSDWCSKELEDAMKEESERGEIFVVPVLHRTCEIPEFLKDKVYADCRSERYQEGFAQLREQLVG